MDEVGLIVVTAIKRDLCPFHPGRLDGLKRALEAAHAAEGLWRMSRLIVKELRKPAVASAQSH